MSFEYGVADLGREVIHLILFALAKLVPKQGNLWVFGAWKGDKYSDNSKYLFEYVCRHHKEIEAIWLTKNALAYEIVKRKQLPAVYFDSLRGIWACMRAGIAIACYDMTQDLPGYAISDKTKLVQLWHGLGPKGYNMEKMGAREQVAVSEMDYFSKVVNKLVLILAWMVTRKWYNGIKWLPYYQLPIIDLVVTTSKLGVEKMRAVFGESAAKIEMLGYPRHDVLIGQEMTQSDLIRVLYAPTHRTESQAEVITHVEEFNGALKRYPQIKLMVKLHNVVKDKVENVKLLSEREIDQDIYTIFPQVDVLITDYSSIYTDFLLLNRPIVFTPFDLADYRDRDQGFFMDYDAVTPGPKAKDWAEAIKLAATHREWSRKYESARQQTLELFHQVRDGESSRRITERLLKLGNEVPDVIPD